MFRQLRYSWLLFVLVSIIASDFTQSPVSAQPHVPLAICPAIDRDNDFEGEGDSRPVVLMVKGKFQHPEGEKESLLELQIEEVLFGNNPGRVIRFSRLPDPDFFDRFAPRRGTLDGGIYSFACVRRDGRLVYDSDAYRFLHRYLPDSELPAAKAIAAARFDRLVLGCQAIVVGRPKTAVAENDKQPRMSNAGPLDIPHPPMHDGIDLPSDTFGLLTNDDVHEQRIGSRQQAVVVERSLYGSFKSGDEFPAQLGYRATPIPLSGDGPFLYFIADDINGVQQLETVWNVSAEAQVRAAIARREQYPLENSDVLGGKSNRREILFPGTIAEAVALLDSDDSMARQMGIERVLHEGPQARAEIVKAIEANFFRVREGKAERFRSDYYQPWRIIRVLGKLERAQPTGEIPRLIDLMLARAHAGTSFPLQPEVDGKLPVHLQRRFNPYASFDVDDNHCLAWLVKELPPTQAAQRYLEPLKRLRDLTAYGWGQEAQAIIDRLQLEDRLALPAALKASENQQPLFAQSSKLPVSEIEELRFAPDNVTIGIKIRTGLRRAWNSTTGRMTRNESGSTSPQLERGWREPVAWLAEDGRRWTFFEDSYAYYYKGEGHGPPGAMDIVVTAKDESADWARDFDFDKENDTEIEKLHPGLLGRVELVAHEHSPPCGLVPGNEFVFVRTNIYARKDLRLISAANVLGNLDGISFSAKGERYAVITTNYRDDPDPDLEFDDDFPIFRRVQREDSKPVASEYFVRVHDTQSGRTIFATKSSHELLKVALAPNGRRVAAVNDRGEVMVWEVPEVAVKRGSP